MKKYLIIALLSFFALNSSAKTIEERNVSKFNKISVCCGINVYITEGNSSKLKIETNNEEFLDYIITEVKGDELKISVKENRGKSFRNVTVTVSLEASNLKEIKSTSGSGIHSVGKLNADDIEINASSGSNIKLDINAQNLICKATSGSDITLKGSAEYAEVSANSAGDIKMKDMTVINAVAKASSGADISLTVTNDLNANANSGADIKYSGDPKNVIKSANSGGSIKKR